MWRGRHFPRETVQVAVDADVGFTAGNGELQPAVVRVCIRIGEDFHGLRHFQRFVDGVRLAVHFGADDVVTDFGMDGVSQIHRCCAVRQGDEKMAHNSETAANEVDDITVKDGKKP